MKLISATLIFAFIVFSPAVADANDVKWQEWSENIFDRAKSEKKPVYLNLEAVWCHWCHVMEKKTYSDKQVAEILNKSFIAVKVDQDSHPGLSVRYRDFGWPATIIFNSSGEEIKKLSGFIEPVKLKAILESSLKNPKPPAKGEIDLQFSEQTSLDPQHRKELIKKHYTSLDTEKGGLRTAHKFLDFETIEYSFINAAAGSEKDGEFVKLSLRSNLKLLDPVWGGVYQYSTGRSWDHPHFEKIMISQADNLKLYSWAYSLWGDEEYWDAATSIYRYINDFLRSENGAYFTSQDADLVKGEHAEGYFKLNNEERRKKGIPAVDKSIYSRENGWIIGSLTALYAATGNKAMLDDATRAAAWIEKNRSLPDGGFKHGDKDNGGPFLGDSLSMGHAYLSIYMVTGERSWLEKSEKTAGYIHKTFSDKTGAPGYLSVKAEALKALAPHKDLTENIQAARYLNLLFHYTGKKEYKDKAAGPMRYIANPAILGGYVNYSGILTADHELNSDPLHVTVVGQKDDPTSKSLFSAGLKYFSAYKRLEWWDKREGPMPNPDVEYPQMSKPAAFICTNQRCSLPIFKPEGVAKTITMLHKDQKPPNHLQ